MKSGLLALLALSLLSGCASLGFGGKKTAAPAIAASVQPATSILDSLSGGLMGQKLGAAFDKSDRPLALEAEYKSLEQTPAGVPAAWTNPKTGNSGEVIAAQPYRVGSQNCRQYTHTFNVGVTPQSAKGTACRNADGSWTRLT